MSQKRLSVSVILPLQKKTTGKVSKIPHRDIFKNNKTCKRQFLNIVEKMFIDKDNYLYTLSALVTLRRSNAG